MAIHDLHCSISLEDCALLLRRLPLPVPVAVTRIARGEVNACFQVGLVNGQRVVLKVQVRAPRPEALLREREACELLAQVSAVPVPQVLDVNVARDLLPFNYSILTFLRGVEADILWPRLPPSKHPTVVRDLGRVLAHIHHTALPQNHILRELVLPPSHQRMLAEQQRRFEELVESHSRASFLPSWLLDQVRQFWSQRKPSLAETDQICLLHGDYQLFNIKLSSTGARVTGVFDLDQVEIGHPEADFAALEVGLLSARPDLRKQFYEAYHQVHALAPGSDQRTALYTLLRHLRIVLAYQGPARFEDGSGASAEAIARLVARPAGEKPTPTPRLGGLVTPPRESRPGTAFDDPSHPNSITPQYLAHVLAKGTRQPVAVTYWHRIETPAWQVFPGRSSARLHFYQIAARLSGAATRDLALVLKITHSHREAMFYHLLAPLLGPHVPKVYHVVLRSGRSPHWLFLESIPWMVLGPVWEGSEFAKALEGMAALHSRFWQHDLLDRCDWLPVINPDSLMSQFRSDVSALQHLLDSNAVPRSLRQHVTSLLTMLAASPNRPQEIAQWLLPQPYTLLHGDYHFANLGTRTMSADSPVVIADWQSCARGPLQMDLAYFLDRMQGLRRKKPDRRSLVATYLSLLAPAAGLRLSEDAFQRGLAAATFFGDLRSLRGLLADLESEASWRGNIFHRVDEEVSLRVRRACLRQRAAGPL